MFRENLYSAVWCALSTAFRTTRGKGGGRQGGARVVTGGSLQVFAAASSAHAAPHSEAKTEFCISQEKFE